MNVRRAVPDDIPWLLEQCRAFAAFFGSTKSLYPGDDMARSALFGFITEHPFFVAENGAGPAGFIVGHLAPHWMNPNIRVLTELLWWVAPAARGSSAGARLLEHLVDAGEQGGADWIVLSLEPNSPLRQTTLERRGFALHERVFLKQRAA